MDVVRGKRWAALFRLAVPFAAVCNTRLVTDKPKSVGLPARRFRELRDRIPADDGRADGVSAPIPTG
jgi:hypothetical protein